MIRVDSLQTRRLVTMSELMNMQIIIPKFQRQEDEFNTGEIVKYQTDRLSNHGSFLFLGELVLAQSSQGLFLVDGQHRFSAMKMIHSLQPSYQVSLLFVSTDETLTMEELFLLINKSKPVSEYVINNVLNVSRKNTLDNFIELFCIEYGEYLSKSNAPKRPNVHIKNIADVASSSQVISYFSSGEQLMEYMKWINITYWKSLCDKKGLSLCHSKGTNKNYLYMSADRDNEWLRKTSFVEQFFKQTKQIKKNN